MQRGLVGAQVHPDAFGGEAFPQVHHVAHVGERDHFPALHGPADTRDQFVQAVVEFVHPALFVTLVRGQRVDLRRHAHHAGDVSGLGLGAGHAAQAGRYE